MIQAAPRARPANLPAHVNAALPKSYEAAKTALALCNSIDECKDWADKAQALASYAKQANDEELMKMATRIRDRAIRRMGELLKQIEPASGARSDLGPVATRGSFAAGAGISPRQSKQAVRVANIPAADFDQQVEGPNPPPASALAEQGKKAAPRPIIDLKGRDPDEFNLALHYVGGWEHVARDLAALKHDAALPILTPSERARLHKAITAIDAITDRIITRI